MEQTFKMSYEICLSYDVKRVSNIFNLDNPVLSEYVKTRRAFCLIDKNLVAYVSFLHHYFLKYNIEPFYFYVEVSEKNKNIQTILDFTSFCFNHNIARRDRIIAFGGGIVCDLAGLSANLLRRGTPCIKIPTTLLGIIDASVGIKNGINHAESKNSLGTFCPPEVVLIDLSFLNTLPLKEIKNGLVEMMKIVSLKDKSTWHLLKDNIDKFLNKDFNDDAVDLIERSIAFMLHELSSNILEHDLERIVDYGHEFGHLIEVISDFELTHGEAVGIGMLLSNCLAYRLGFMRFEDYEDFKSVFKTLNFPHWHSSLTSQKLYDKRETISRHKGGHFSIVALQEIGHPFFLKELSFADLDYACNSLMDIGTATHSETSTAFFNPLLTNN